MSMLPSPAAASAGSARPSAWSSRAHDFLVFERADDVGGVWRDNTYPGCACDVPVAPLLVLVRAQPGLDAQLLAASRDPRLPPRLRGALRGPARTSASTTRSPSAAWDDAAPALAISRPTHGRCTADVLVGAVGALSEPRSPTCRASRRSPARRSTRRAGTTTTTCGQARRRHRHRRLRDPVRPAHPAEGRRTHVFQRTPPWIIPSGDRDYGARQAGSCLKRVPGRSALESRPRLRVSRSARLALLTADRVISG